MPATEALRSSTLRLMARPAAVWFELVELRVVGYPYRCFDLLQAHAVADEARHLLDCSPCLLDPLSSMIREQYPSEENLESAECQQILHVLASMAQVTTYQGERLHSSNQRRSKRVHVHPMQLHDVALCHMAFCWTTSLCSFPTKEAAQAHRQATKEAWSSGRRRGCETDKKEERRRVELGGFSFPSGLQDNSSHHNECRSWQKNSEPWVLRRKPISKRLVVKAHHTISSKVTPFLRCSLAFAPKRSSQSASDEWPPKKTGLSFRSMQRRLRGQTLTTSRCLNLLFLKRFPFK